MNDAIKALRAIQDQKKSEWEEAKLVADEATKAHVRLQIKAMGIEINKTIFTAKRWCSDKHPQRWVAISVEGSGRICSREVKKDGSRWMSRGQEMFPIDRILEVLK